MLARMIHARRGHSARVFVDDLHAVFVQEIDYKGTCDDVAAAGDALLQNIKHKHWTVCLGLTL
jgi:hypothetical protein